jgi:diguanylate cyclase (GGDEF)-like protein
LTTRAVFSIVAIAPTGDLMADTPQAADPSASDPGGLEERLYARAQELAETQERARLGGMFYPVTWVLACSVAGFGAPIAWLTGALFVGLAYWRFHLPQPRVRTLEELVRALRWPWIVALRSERDRYEQQSRRDGLTGLANRRRFVAALNDQVTRARDGEAPFSLVILDLDQFKSINDRHGHAGGDRCLVAVSAMLRAVYDGPGELPARLGGEEFAVLLPGHDVERAVARTQSFRLRLGSTPIDLGAAQISLTTSAGVGAFDPQRHSDGDALYGEVDQALYRAKAGGRNRVCATEKGG